jgi:hypothetical protein
VVRAKRLTVALFSLLHAGCYDAHAGAEDDAGLPPPRFDAGGAECRETLEASVFELRCPEAALAGEYVEVSLDTAPPWCCGGGAVQAEFRQTHESGFEGVLRWTACDCCDACRCVGPVETVSGLIGPLAPGPNVVEVHGTSCLIEAAPTAGCSPPATATSFRAAHHLLQGQPLSATLTSPEGAGCGCDPRATVSGSSFALELCDCCDDCECVDPGYQSSVVVGDPWPLGEHLLTVPHGVHDLTVHPRSACHPVTAGDVEAFPPDTSLIVTGPRLTWARVIVEECLCCATPAPAFEQTVLADGTIQLTALSCAPDPCDCDPCSPQRAEAWHSLGELAPGTYALTAGAAATTFVVF